MTTRKLILYIILLTVLSITAYVILVVIPTQMVKRSYEGAKQLGKAIDDAFMFTPKVTVNNIVVLEQQTPILELGAVKQQFQHKYEWKNTRLHSTKTITITGTMEAKAGFDLLKRFAIDIDGKKATVTMPNPKLLSVEPRGDLKFEDENGLWNWVNNDDRSTAINGFQTDARRYATEADFITQARTYMEEKLRPLLLQHVDEVKFVYEDAPMEQPLKMLPVE